jgi:pyruvate carboxylase
MEKSDRFQLMTSMPVYPQTKEMLISATEDISRPKADPTDPGQVGAPMSGVVVELRVHVGSQVKKGDPIAVLSAMYSPFLDHKIDNRKMEMVISAPHGGKIDQIKVSEGVTCWCEAKLTRLGFG